MDKGDRVVMTHGNMNAWIGRRAEKNRVSVPSGTVGVVTGHVKWAVRVLLHHNMKLHTVSYGALEKTSIWPGQLRAWRREKGERTTFQVVNCLGWDRESRGLWWRLLDGSGVLWSCWGQTIERESEVISDPS